MPALWFPLVFVSGVTVALPGTTEAFYQALLGTPDVVDAADLAAAPGRYVGHAVRARGRLERGNGKEPEFHLASGSGRVLVRLEPEAAALVREWATATAGLEVEVDGFFYREPDDAAPGVHAIRCWRVTPDETLGERPLPTPAPLLSLEALAYAGGRYDGSIVRVRGIDRGRNRHHDLPEATRRTSEDWVLKDGYFAAWVEGREPGGDPEQASGAAVEVLGVPDTVKGVVRIDARRVHVSSEPTVAAVSGVPTAHPGWAAVPPRVNFAYPVPGQGLGPGRHVILQFSKPMDPGRFEQGVQVRYEKNGTVAGQPTVTLHYRDRSRALVIATEPPPPPGSEVVVELLDLLVDVGGTRLTHRGGEVEPEGVVDRFRFPTVP